MEVRNVIKVPPVRPRVRFLSYQGLRPSPLLSSTLDSLIIPHFHPPHRETLLFALEIFCGTGMGQGNQTATTLSSPLPPPPFPPPPLFSPFFFLFLSFIQLHPDPLHFSEFIGRQVSNYGSYCENYRRGRINFVVHFLC